jgi:anthranilate synthase component 1
MVEAALGHIREGDIFQVVLSRRASVRFDGDPFQAYRALRMINPSPYHFYFQFGETALLGSSPEMLARLTGETLEHVPIAGTRRRGRTGREDAEIASGLLADPKERSEHLMLVDLGRNDLSRVCTPGTVSVERLMDVERFSHVMHLVSLVRGTVRPGVDAPEVLRALFPAGTVSGAPKIRAMQIIDELEDARRGFYSGAAGYIDFSGSMDFCLTIRTMMAFRGELHLQAGAGIVAKSDPAQETEEVRNKLGALFEAIRIAGEFER